MLLGTVQLAESSFGRHSTYIANNEHARPVLGDKHLLVAAAVLFLLALSLPLLLVLQVRQLVLRGTFHAGGFFAPGHLDLAHQAMPHITRLVFMKCGDLKPECLQEVGNWCIGNWVGVDVGVLQGGREGVAGAPTITCCVRQGLGACRH